MRIPDLTSDELSLFGRIVARLENPDAQADVRGVVLEDLVRLLRADLGASYVWSDERQRFVDGRNVNFDPATLAIYDERFQHRDPMTYLLRARRRATPVEAVLPHAAMVRTEFYNDFLKRDGAHHGINMYVFDGDRDLGDFRIWRKADRPDFGTREECLLDALEPFFREALVLANRRFAGLTRREREVAALVARGCTDRDIARILGIGFGTVRTHLNRAMERRGCANRAELAASLRSRD
jgi:DNA-binding CsgD family transcriptional regulator